MTIEIIPFIVGPLENNTYLIADPLSQKAVVIDPGFDPGEIIQTLARRNWQLQAIWITHAHFDHIAGVNDILHAHKSHIPIALHPLDLPLWQSDGGARMFGFALGKLPEPEVALFHQQELALGTETIQVRHTPGHCPGHVVFYLPGAQALICGDVIFYHSVGRTDLPGGNSLQLLKSIRDDVFTFPPETRLLSGHGPESSVAEEIANNPYVTP